MIMRFYDLKPGDTFTFNPTVAQYWIKVNEGQIKNATTRNITTILKTDINVYLKSVENVTNNI